MIHVTWTRVASGFNCYLDITSKCNAACSWCIAPSRGRRDGAQVMDGVVAGLEVASSVRGGVQVVGGEPVLSRHFADVCREIRRREGRFSRTVLNTNGTALLRQMPLVNSVNFTALNISRHHWDDAVNAVIMGTASTPTAVELAAIVRASTVPVRLNCTLDQRAIASPQQAERFVDWAREIGVFQVSFSEMFRLEMIPWQQTLATYDPNHWVNPEPLVTYLDLHVNTTPTRVPYTCGWGGGAWFGGGDVSHRRHWNLAGSWVSVKTMAPYSADGRVQAPSYDVSTDYELDPDVLHFAVVHPDGRVTGSWDRERRVMFVPTPHWVGIPMRPVSSCGGRISIGDEQ